MKLNRELCASRRELSLQAGWTIAMDAVCQKSTTSIWSSAMRYIILFSFVTTTLR